MWLGLKPAKFLALLPDSQLSDLCLWLLGRRSRLRVVGNSMVPTLVPGTEVLVNPRAYRAAFPQVGDVVVAWHPQQPGLKIIKRVTVVLADDRYWLSGDNPDESTDSRHWGAVARPQIIGKVMCRFG